MNINRILENMALVTKRAAELNCTVVAVLNNVILCHRKSDDTYITWRCYIRLFRMPATTTTTLEAIFDAGDYDMNLETGKNNLILRSNWTRPSNIRQVVEQCESLCLDDETDRETLISKLIN